MRLLGLRSYWLLKWCMILSAGIVTGPYLLALLAGSSSPHHEGHRLRKPPEISEFDEEIRPPAPIDTFDREIRPPAPIDTFDREIRPTALVNTFDKEIRPPAPVDRLDKEIRPPAPVNTLNKEIRPAQVLPNNIKKEVGKKEGNATWIQDDFVPYPGWTAEAEARMSERRRQVKTACSLFGLDIPGNDSLHRANPWEFLVNRKHKLVWCNVFKAASTSWMYNFNVLAGYSHKFLQASKLVPLTLARRKYPRPSWQELQEALNDSIAFLIVRHPLERLLSAYRDKIQFALPYTLHQKLGNAIIQKYRTGSQKKGGTRWPTFSEFVQYLVDENRGGELFDMHWTPITQFCTPCQVDFHIIGKFETLQEDQNYLIHLANLQELIRPEWKNSGKGQTTSELVESYYSQLTRAQILQLYYIYQHDFELFGYTLDGFLNIAMTEDASAT